MQHTLADRHLNPTHKATQHHIPEDCNPVTLITFNVEWVKSAELQTLALFNTMGAGDKINL
jgi:hypothetical protein